MLHRIDTLKMAPGTLSVTRISEYPDNSAVSETTSLIHDRCEELTSIIVKPGQIVYLKNDRIIIRSAPTAEPHGPPPPPPPETPKVTEVIDKKGKRKTTGVDVPSSGEPGHLRKKKAEKYRRIHGR